MNNWINYTADHFYFITLITNQKKPYFGYIQNGIMHPNRCAELAQQIWFEQLTRYAYLYHHKFIIMPNHLHAIIEFRQDTFSPCSERISLPKFIAQYKSKTTVFIHRLGIMDFRWQSGFYDHIIRNGETFKRLSHYIETNPVCWEMDKLYYSP